MDEEIIGPIRCESLRISVQVLTLLTFTIIHLIQKVVQVSNFRSFQQRERQETQGIRRMRERYISYAEGLSMLDYQIHF